MTEGYAALRCAATRGARSRPNPRGDGALAAPLACTLQNSRDRSIACPLAHPTGQRDAQNLLSARAGRRDWSIAACVAGPPKKQVNRAHAVYFALPGHPAARPFSCRWPQLMHRVLFSFLVCFDCTLFPWSLLVFFFLASNVTGMTFAATSQRASRRMAR